MMLCQTLNFTNTATMAMFKLARNGRDEINTEGLLGEAYLYLQSLRASGRDRVSLAGLVTRTAKNTVVLYLTRIAILLKQENPVLSALHSL